MGSYSDQPTYEYDTQDFIQPAEAVELKHGNTARLNDHRERCSESENSEKSESKSPSLPTSFVQVSYDELEFCECCGQGTFGSVYRVLWLTQGKKEVAVKKLNNMDKEAHVLNLLSHRNIIQFYGACVDPPNFCIVTEYAPYGSLFDFLTGEESRKLEYNQLLSWARDIALGMNYLHEEAPVTVIHRDLKSKNVVICEDFVLKICDFGASRFFGDTVVMTITGTYPWMAPELIQGLPTSELCDVYSFGVVLWELLTREIPFKGLQGFQVAWAVVEREERPVIPASCPQRFADLIGRCWSSIVSNRPSFYDIIGELNTMLNNEKLMDSTNSFMQSKDSWMGEMREKIEEMKRQEEEVGAKEEELARKEEKLKMWEKRLLEEMKKQTLVASVKHHKKTENLQFNIAGTGKGAIDSVKDALNHVMAKSSFGNNEPHSSGFGPFSGPKVNNSVKSLDSWPSLKRSESECGSDMPSFGSKFRPRFTSSQYGGIPKFSSQKEEPLIESDIKFDKSELNNNLSIFSKSPFQDAGMGTPTNSGRANGKFPRNKVQQQVSSSSEEFSFEGSKMSRSTSETVGGKTKEPEVETWESAKGNANVKKSSEQFEYDPGEKNATHKTFPSNPKFKSHNSTPNLFSQINNFDDPSSSFPSGSTSQAPTENEIFLALNSMLLKPECEALGKDFAFKLSEAIKEVYASKQRSPLSLSENGNGLENKLEMKRALKPRLSLKPQFSSEENILNGGTDFSFSECQNFSKSSNSSKIEKKSHASSFNSSNDFSQMSNTFHKKESCETKNENKTSRRLSLTGFQDGLKTKNMSEISSSQNHHQKNSFEDRRTSITSGLPGLKYDIQTLDWGGMIKPDTKDKFVQTNPPEKNAKLKIESASKPTHNQSTQTDEAANRPIPCGRKPSHAKPPVKALSSNTDMLIKLEKENRDQSALNSHRNSSVKASSTEGRIEKEATATKKQKSLVSRKLPNIPFILAQNFRRKSGEGADLDLASTMSRSGPAAVTSIGNKAAPSQNTVPNAATGSTWKRSMSTPEIRDLKNFLVLSEKSLDAFESPRVAAGLTENKDNKSSVIHEKLPKFHSIASEESVKPGTRATLPRYPQSPECYNDRGSSKCKKLHQTMSLQNEACKQEKKLNDNNVNKKPVVQLRTTVSNPLSSTFKSSAEDGFTNFSNENPMRSRLKSDSGVKSFQTKRLLPSPDLSQLSRKTDSLEKNVFTGDNIKLQIDLNGQNQVLRRPQFVADPGSRSRSNNPSVNSVTQSAPSTPLILHQNRQSETRKNRSETAATFTTQSQSSNANLPCKFASEIKLIRHKKPRKYVSKQNYNDVDHHIISDVSASNLHGLPATPNPNPENNQSNIFETDDYTYIIRPKGRGVHAQGV